MDNVILPVVEWMPTSEAAAAGFNPDPNYATSGAGAFDLRIFAIEYGSHRYEWDEHEKEQTRLTILDSSLIKIHTGLRMWIGQPTAQRILPYKTLSFGATEPGVTLVDATVTDQIILPYKYLGVVTVRSSTGSRGLRLLNSVAFIDSDYQGEIVLVAQHMLGSASPLILTVGDRVAQMAVVPVMTPNFVKVSEFPEVTARGIGGFGSTGT